MRVDTSAFTSILLKSMVGEWSNFSQICERASKMIHYQIPGSAPTCTAIYSSKEPLRLWVIPQLIGSAYYMWSLYMYSWPRDMLLCWIGPLLARDLCLY